MATENVTLDELLTRVKKLETKFDNNQIFKTVNGENGYVAFNNGLCIQWTAVRKSINSNWTFHNFPVPFTAKPWNIWTTLVKNINGDAYSNDVSINYALSSASQVVLFESGASYSTYFANILAIGMVDTTKLYYNLVDFFSSALLGVRRWLSKI